MCIRSLGPLCKAFSLTFLLVLLASCNANNSSMTQYNACSGCAFVYATTNAGQLLTFQAGSNGALGTPTITQGAANSPYLTAPLGSSTLYASDSNNNAIDAFAVDETNGMPTAITGSPFSMGASTGNPAGIANFENCLYVGDTNGTVVAFNITSDEGLTTASGSPYSAGFAPVNLLAYNTGSFAVLYAADFTGGGIWGFTIGSNCTLTPIPGSPFATADNSAPAAITVNWTTIYVALSGLNEIAAYSVNESGALVPVPGSPFAAGRGPASLLAYNTFLYALNGLDHTISAYSVDQSTGALTGVAGSPFAAGTAFGGLINGDGGGVYVPDSQANSILGFSINESTGSLAPISGSPFLTSAAPEALTSVILPILDPPAP
jgi:6-phosphogluconolactonase